MVSKTLVERLQGAKEEFPGTPTRPRLVGTDHALWEKGVEDGWKAALDLAVKLGKEERFADADGIQSGILEYRLALDFALRHASEFPDRILVDAAPEERAIKAGSSHLFTGSTRLAIREEMRRAAVMRLGEIDEQNEAAARKDAGKPNLLDVAEMARTLPASIVSKVPA